MYIYLNKKIQLPQKGVQVRDVSWNAEPEQGWIACAADAGLLKVLKLESAGTGKDKGIAGSSNLSMNQTLEGHEGAVQVVRWNEQYKRLSSSDDKGLIIVWMLHKGAWYEEMVNNRNQSVVQDMKWSADGQKIAIVYADGHVIVGGVDGNRLWGKDMPIGLLKVEWSPDARTLLLGTSSNTVQVLDQHGNYMVDLRLYNSEDNSPIAAMHWYDGLEGLVDPNAPTLAVCFVSGRVQLMRHEGDTSPVLIETGLTLQRLAWNTNGSVIAIGGTQVQRVGDKERMVCMVQFFTPFGQYLRSLKVPGSSLNGLSWENGGLRVALAVDSFIYFANVRPDYKWGMFGNTLVYAYSRPERTESGVVFFNTETGERFSKYVKGLSSICAAGEYCVLCARVESANDSQTQYILILCNAIGSPVDSKYISVEPKFCSMTSTHVVVANDRAVFCWQYRSRASKLTLVDDTATGFAEDREVLWHIDSLPTGGASTLRPSQETGDTIAAIAANSNTLLISRNSGIVMRYALPHLSLECKYNLRSKAQKLSINCDGTKFSIIDVSSVLTLFDCEARPAGAPSSDIAPGEQLSFERKDCWDVLWSSDQPDLFASMEKAKMYVFRGTSPEEPVVSSGYLCRFGDLEITSVLLDEVFMMPDSPSSEVVVSFETKALRDTKELLANSVGMEDVYKFIGANSHPRLWRTLAEHCMNKVDIGTAERALVKCQDYSGLQFIKRLRQLPDKSLQLAEVAVHQKKFIEAEKLYLQMGRPDLAVELRASLGDWIRVVEYAKGGNASDDAMRTAQENIGQYMFERHRWRRAATAFDAAGRLDMLSECLYFLEDFDGLRALLTKVPETDRSLLVSLGEKFKSVGLAEEAVEALHKAGEIQQAVECCVDLNQWAKAVELAEEAGLSHIDALLSKYATKLLDAGQRNEAVDLYRRAGKHADSARLLHSMGEEVMSSGANPLRAKQLFVLAALEVENFRKKNLSAKAGDGTGGTTTMLGGMTMATAAQATATVQTLSALIDADSQAQDNKILDNAWHSAEAVHFYMLAQRQLYTARGQGIVEAFITALRLRQYEDVLGSAAVNALIALTGLHCGFNQQASNAFLRLEKDEGASADRQDAFSSVAVDVFSRIKPEDPKEALSTKCNQCQPDETKPSKFRLRPWMSTCPKCSYRYKPCVITGRLIIDMKDKTTTHTCRRCRHCFDKRDQGQLRFCPMCHYPIDKQQKLHYPVGK